MSLNKIQKQRGRKKKQVDEQPMLVDEEINNTDSKLEDQNGLFAIHRVKFFNYKANTIHCLAYDEDNERLAVVRSDGSIEIWNMKHNFNQERVIPSSQNAKLDSVVWVKGRLFSTGFHGDITEYDLLRNTVKHTVLYGNASWCIAANKTGTLLATGNDDGCVRLFDLTTEQVTYDRTFNPTDQRIVSLGWHESDEVLVTGSIDNIRIWNVATGSAVQRITLQRTFKKRETIVWCIAILSDHTIVSGDSTGRTIFWDGQLGTMLKGFTSHRMDILSLCVTKDETSVFTTGVDPTIVQFTLSLTDDLESARTWARNRHITYGHTHDIRAMVIAGKFLISGGLDTKLITNPVDISPGQPQIRLQLGQYRRNYDAFLQKKLISFAGDARLLLFQYPHHLEVWQLGSTNDSPGKEGESLTISGQPMKILDIKTKGIEQIVCSSISKNGEWIAYSDVNSVKLFHFNLQIPSLQKVSYLPTQLCPSHHLLFSPDSSSLFLATSSSSVQVLTLDEIQPVLQHTFHTMDNSILVLGVDVTGKFVAAGDVDGNINVYNVKSFKVHCRLPRYGSQPTALAFSPHAPKLFIAYSDQMLYEYNVELKSYTDWSRRLHQAKMHHAWLQRRQKITQIIYSDTNPNIVFVHDFNMLCAIDQSKALPKSHHQLFRKQMQELKEQYKFVQNHAFNTHQQFKPLLFMDHIGDGEGLVIVEYPVQHLIENLPATLKQKKYGT